MLNVKYCLFTIIYIYVTNDVPFNFKDSWKLFDGSKLSVETHINYIKYIRIQGYLDLSNVLVVIWTIKKSSLNK